MVALSAFSSHAFAADVPSARGNGNEAIRLEDLDKDGNGVASEAERKSYFRQLELDAQKEYAEQEAIRQRLAREASERQKAAIASSPAPPVNPTVKSATIEKKPMIKRSEDKNVTPYLQKKYKWREGEMEAFDTNGDGILQKQELNASVDTKFNSADLDKNGVLSQQETKLSLEKYKTDNKASYGGAVVDQQANRMNSRYRNADDNDDKKVSKEEYERYMSKHQANFDRDGDGAISSDEYRTDGERVPAMYSRKPVKKKGE